MVVTNVDSLYLFSQQRLGSSSHSECPDSLSYEYHCCSIQPLVTSFEQEGERESVCVCVCVCVCRHDHIPLLKILQSMSGLVVLWKHRNNPASTKSVRVFKRIKLHTIQKKEEYVTFSYCNSWRPAGSQDIDTDESISANVAMHYLCDKLYLKNTHKQTDIHSACSAILLLR